MNTSPTLSSKQLAISLVFSLGILSGMTYLFARFDYDWAWAKVPQYFWTEKIEETFASDPGVIKIFPANPTHVILQTENGEETFDIPEKFQLVKDSDHIYAGDLIAKEEISAPGPLLEGLALTLELSLASSILGLFLGLVSGLMKNSKHPLLHYPSAFYIEIMRGTPLLVQLFIIYFIFGTVVGLDDRFTCGVLSLGLFSGAYAGEIIRSGIQNIHFGQMEAARALGLSHTQTMLFIILPQVFKDTLASLSGVFISLIKDSSLVSVMAITDLTKAGREIVSSSFMVFEIWITVGLLYFVMTYGLSRFAAKLEKHLRKGERQGTRS